MAITIYAGHVGDTAFSAVAASVTTTGAAAALDCDCTAKV
jgi:hypothetical protein